MEWKSIPVSDNHAGLSDTDNLKSAQCGYLLSFHEY